MNKFEELEDLTLAIKMTSEDLKKMRAKRFKLLEKIRKDKEIWLIEKQSTATKF